MTTDDTDFHGFKNTPNRFENVSITLSSSVPFRVIRGSISVFGSKSCPACGDAESGNLAVMYDVRADA
jgi:hypothetical protein